MKKFLLKKKKYKSFNFLIYSKVYFLIKASFVIIPFKLDRIITYFHLETTQKTQILFFCYGTPMVFIKELKKNLLGLCGGWFLKFQVVGRGFLVINSKKFLKFNLGYSHALGYFLPSHVFALSNSNKKTEICLFSYQFTELLTLAYFFRSLKKLNSYKEKGVKFEKEIIKLKPGKKTQT